MTDGKTPSFPHDCPSCGAPAYIGGPGMPAQCTNGHAKDGKPCPFFSEDNWIRWIMELPDPGDPEPEEESERPDSELTDAEWSAKHLDIDEEATTEPGIGYASVGAPLLKPPTLADLYKHKGFSILDDLYKRGFPNLLS